MSDFHILNNDIYLQSISWVFQNKRGGNSSMKKNTENVRYIFIRWDMCQYVSMWHELLKLCKCVWLIFGVAVFNMDIYLYHRWHLLGICHISIQNRGWCCSKFSMLAWYETFTEVLSHWLYRAEAIVIVKKPKKKQTKQINKKNPDK